MKQQIAMIAAFALTAGGCCVIGITMYRPDFQLSLVDTKAENIAVTLEEGDISITWAFSPREIKATIENKTQFDIAIDWPAARFLDFEGSEHQLTGISGWKGVVKLDRQIVQARTTSVALVYPEGFVKSWGRMILQPRMPGIASSERETAESFGQDHLGDQARVVLPIEVGDSTWTYTFSIATTNVAIKKICGT